VASQTVSTRLEKELDADIRLVMAVEHLDRAKALRRILHVGSQRWRLQYALQLLGDGRVTVAKAAEIARVSLWEMIDLIREGKVVLPIALDDVLNDIQAAAEAGGSA
jgi:predicted HTH domain antitoxin